MGTDRKASVMEERASFPLLLQCDQRLADRSLGSPLAHGKKRLILSVEKEGGCKCRKYLRLFSWGFSFSSCCS